MGCLFPYSLWSEPRATFQNLVEKARRSCKFINLYPIMMPRQSPNRALGSTYLMGVVIASLVYMVRERTWEFFLFDELAVFVICILIWRESHKWVDLVKMIWKPQPCTIEKNHPDMSPPDPDPQLMAEETESDFEVIDEESHTDCCSNIPRESLEALIKGFVFNTKGEGNTAAEGNSTLDADECTRTSEVKSKVTAFYISVAEYLAKVYSIVSPGNTTPEVRLTNVLKLLLPVIVSRDDSTLHVKFDVPQSSDPTNEVGERSWSQVLTTSLKSSADNHALNENEKTETLAFANRVFDFISRKLALDRKVLEECACPAPEYECKIMHTFVAHMLSTFENTASLEVNFEVGTGLLLFEKLVTHLVETFALVKHGDTTPETKYKVIKKTLFYKTKFDDKEFAKSKLVVGYSNTESGSNTTGAENTAIFFLKRIFDNLCIKNGLKNSKAEKATVVETVETKRVVGNSTNESEYFTTGVEDTTLTAHEEDEVISFIERIFNYLGNLVDLKNLIAVEGAAATGNFTPEAPLDYIQKFIVDMVYFLNK